MKLIKKLMQEHQLILHFINLFQNHIKNEHSKSNLNTFEMLVDFIENYADRYHHAKEEAILFQELEKPGTLSHCNPVRQMIFEHDQSRHHVQQIKKGIQTQDSGLVLTQVQNYCFLLQQHIYKEDHILYPMSEQSLTETQKSQIDACFEEKERTLNGSEIEAKYERMYTELSQNLKTVLVQ